jgi:deaminated glutathione amidase
MSRLRVALVQLDAGEDAAANVTEAARLAGVAAQGGARLVALPEYLQFRGSDEGYRASARPIPGPFSDAFAAVAREHGVWILAGTLAESGPAGRPYNTSVLIDPSGAIAATYRKIHLFDVDLEDGSADQESDRVTPGNRAVVAEVDGAKIGLTICYDLRFPELYRALAVAGAEILAVPANFLERTGRDHWEVLLRARAIENGAYVVAPAQIGTAGGVRSHGRSMIIDPWGTVVAQAADEVAIIQAELDLDRVAAIRRQIPVLANRRPGAIRFDDPLPDVAADGEQA